ncbi:MAG: alpha/beta fold hydrolase [Schleiferiaceae bacterium]|jgi:pimeloyl-ACP methyl ester carboxylesterase|nr:alpha/beta fold hydrolase [Schleiferiaceae bacterium]
MKLFHKIIGEGEPIIIMHGLFGMLDNWQTFAKALNNLGYQVHLLDMRNHGRSPHSLEFSYQVMADDLEEYMDDQNIESAHILGHSMGGKVAMVFATENEERTKSLIVVDIAPKAYPVHHQDIIAGLKSLDFSTIKSRGEATEQLGKYIDNAAVKQFLLKSLYWESKEKLALRFNLSVIDQNINMVGEALFDNAVYEGPTLFVDGGASNYIKESDGPLIKSHFPKAEIDTIPGSGHWVHAEQPKLFYESVVRFLDHQ